MKKHSQLNLYFVIAELLGAAVSGGLDAQANSGSEYGGFPLFMLIFFFLPFLIFLCFDAYYGTKYKDEAEENRPWCVTELGFFAAIPLYIAGWVMGASIITSIFFK